MVNIYLWLVLISNRSVIRNLY